MMDNPLKIKVCGMREPENLEQLCSIGPDYVGYIFYPKSKRFVGINPDPALFRIPPAEILKVGVFVNEEMDQLIQMVEAHHLDLVQLHGNESPAYCGKLMDLGVRIIKAISLSGGEAGSKLKPRDAAIGDYKEVVQNLLYDTPVQGWGGSGQKFDWNLLNKQHVSLPFILSGGIGPEDARAIRELKQKDLLGIDLNSRFELSPGVKDIGLLEKFFMDLRK